MSPFPCFVVDVPKAALGGRVNIIRLAFVASLALLASARWLVLLNWYDDDDGVGESLLQSGHTIDCPVSSSSGAASPLSAARIVYFVPVDGAATHSCALRALGHAAGSALGSSNNGHGKAPPPSVPTASSSSSALDIILSNSIKVNSNSTSDDIPRFRELLEMRERHQRLHSGMIFDAWYHAPLRPACVWPLVRDWLFFFALPSSSAASDYDASPNRRGRVDTSMQLELLLLVLPPGPQLRLWQADDLAFANKLAPESTFVVLGGSNTSDTLIKEYDAYRDTCLERAHDPSAHGSIQAQLLAGFRSPRLVCSSATEIDASRMLFVDCSPGE